MGKDFSSKDVKSLVKEHNGLIESLKSACKTSDEYKDKIKHASEMLAKREAVRILNGIPVEELNRDKNGIKTKILRDNNICSVGQVCVMDVESITAVHGVGEESARLIKSVSDNFVEQTAKGVKLKLSTDDKNYFSTELVTCVSVYKNSIECVNACKDVLYAHENKVNELIKDVDPALNELKWIFTSKKKKETATEAYIELKQLMDDRYAVNVHNLIKKLDDTVATASDAAWDDFRKNSVMFYRILEDICPGLLGTDDSMYGLPEELAKTIQNENIFVEGLLCSLRRYQEWGVRYILHQKQVLLGDEMGLGKTIQAIACMASLKNEGATHFIVVCPASVLANWCREIQKFSTLSVTVVHGTGRESAIEEWINAGGVAVTTYETTAHFVLPDEYIYSMLVVDEAHYIKNPSARRTKNTVLLSEHAERRLFMTGTALENRVDEMISLINLLRPDIAEDAKSIAFMASAPQFREKIAPVYYRRKREDVLTELPDLIENREWCELSREEEKIYEAAVLEKKYAQARRVSWNVGDLKYSTKAQRLLEIVDEAADDGRKVVVFTFFLDNIKEISTLLGTNCLRPITGAVSPQDRQEIIDEFDKSASGTVLLAQIQSGGTGLNIQSASVVVICEPQFKPSIENQAVSRAYRMGQTRNVLVYRLLSENTIEEKITEILDEKQRIFDAFADKSAAADMNAEIDDKALSDIFEEEFARISEKYNS